MTSSLSMTITPISQLRALRPDRHAWGQEPYHQGEPCPELNKAGWVLGAFVPQLDPGPECSLSWAVAR